MKLREIVDLCGGELVGDPEIEITGASGLEMAGPSEITYVGDRKYLPQLEESRADAVILAERTDTNRAQVVHNQPALAFARVLAKLHPEPQPAPGIHSTAVVGPESQIGEQVFLGPKVVIGSKVTIGNRSVLHPGVVVGDHCHIGEDAVLFPNVVVYANTTIGNRVRIHAGAVIGADGFSYTPDEKGRHVKLQQIGTVQIEDDVEIGANTCIDRAAFGETRIGEGVKIDNLVQVAHNCNVGKHSILVSQVGLSGSCNIGRHNVLAGQVGLADHVTLGDQITLLARAGVFRDIDKPGMYGGAPAQPIVDLARVTRMIQKLPELASDLRDLERRLHAIEKR